MKWILGVLLVLTACAQPIEQVYAPTAQVIFDSCESIREVGESCSANCECLRPSKCINNICSLTGLENGKYCVENKQCLSGYCTQTNTCGGPDGPTAGYNCEIKCNTYDSDECHTVCKHR